MDDFIVSSEEGTRGLGAEGLGFTALSSEERTRRNFQELLPT